MVPWKDEVLLAVVRAAIELLESQRGMIVEPLSICIIQQSIESGATDLATFSLLMFGNHLRLGWGRDTAESAQHRQGKHYVLVLRRATGSPKQAGNLSD